MSVTNNSMTIWEIADIMRLDEMSENTIPLLTIGYEGYNITDFVCQLKSFNVGYIFDVREIPFSRKKGFSKAPFSKIMEDNNIKYHHFKELGSPKNIRDRLHKDNDYDTFFYDYEKYLETQTDSLKILSTAISENRDIRFCLLCFEKNPAECHRSILAQKISQEIEEDVEIVNI